jgi:hypothetical protein
LRRLCRSKAQAGQAMLQPVQSLQVARELFNHLIMCPELEPGDLRPPMVRTILNHLLVCVRVYLHKF